jgi:hypothetical protein
MANSFVHVELMTNDVAKAKRPRNYAVCDMPVKV